MKTGAAVKKAYESPSSTSASTQELLRELLVRLGEDPERDGLVRTPERMQKALEYLTKGYQQDSGEHQSRFRGSILPPPNRRLCRAIQNASPKKLAPIGRSDRGNRAQQSHAVPRRPVGSTQKHTLFWFLTDRLLFNAFALLCPLVRIYASAGEGEDERWDG